MRRFLGDILIVLVTMLSLLSLVLLIDLCAKR